MKTFSLCSSRAARANRHPLRAPWRARSLVAVLFGALITKLVPLASGEPPMLQPGTYIYAGGAPLQPGSYAIPCVTDWNGDGKKDLIVGYQTAGKLALYLNSGTDAQPVFTSWSNLQAGGVDIVHTSGGCGAPAPWVCDYDGDGKRDLLVGAGQDGTIYFYRNINTDANPVLAPGVQLTAGSFPLSVGSRATPYVYDWDGDGLNDLLCGDGNGYVTIFRNIGTAYAPAYAAGAAAHVQAGGEDLYYGNLGIRSIVRVVDWDGDGRPDLVCSASYNSGWCRNVSSSRVPVLEALRVLQVPAPGTGLAPLNSFYRMRLEVVDWNNDGVADLLIGTDSGYVLLYEGYRFAFCAAACQTGSRLALQWNSAPYLKYNLLAGSSLANIQTILAADLPSGGKITGCTNEVQGAHQFFRLQVAP